MLEELREKVSLDIPLVTIVDLKNLRLATPKVLRDSIKKFTILNVISRIYINVPKILISQTQKLRKQQVISILFADNFQEAFFLAKDIVKDYNLKENWKYQIGNFIFEARLISNKILYLKYINSIVAENSTEFIEKLTLIFNSIKEEKIIVVQDYTKMGSNSLKSKRDFTDFFKQHPKIKATVLFGVSDNYKLQVKIAVTTNFIGYPIVIKNTYREALEVANKILKDEYKDGNIYLDKSSIDNRKDRYLDKVFTLLNRRYIKDLKNYLFHIQKGKDNKVIHHFINKHPFKDILESFRIIVSDIHDLSSDYEYKEQELIKTQKELLRMKKKLEKKVKERVKELTEVNFTLKKEIIERKLSEQRVKISRKIAEREDMTKTIFLKGISGKLKVSVENILVMIENLKTSDSLEHDYIKKELKKIISASDELFKEVQDLVTHSQLESGNIKYNIERNSFLDAINKSILDTKFFIKEKNITIIISNSDNLNEYIPFDKHKIIQVINNLLSNAIKYSNKNSQITITTSNYNNELKFVISDSGIGIKTGKTISIFENFSTNMKLMISKKIINHHGGRIWVKNNKNSGATFIFTLPLS